MTDMIYLQGVHNRVQLLYKVFSNNQHFTLSLILTILFSLKKNPPWLQVKKHHTHKVAGAT